MYIYILALDIKKVADLSYTKLKLEKYEKFCLRL